jgi:NAD(P)H-hydrate epimerase
LEQALKAAPRLEIISVAQMRAIEGAAAAAGVATRTLMEEAGAAVAQTIAERFSPRSAAIVCGPGNNGGDGLGVARLLQEAGYKVSVWVVKGDAEGSRDFNINLERLGQAIEVSNIGDTVWPEIFSDVDILLDSIFGSGLSRPVEGIYARVIECLNALAIDKIAIDIPSGLMADKPSDLGQS